MGHFAPIFRSLGLSGAPFALNGGIPHECIGGEYGMHGECTSRNAQLFMQVSVKWFSIFRTRGIRKFIMPVGLNFIYGECFFIDNQ
jgi:hypothetical protein